MTPLQICHACPTKQPPPYRGPCACLADPAKPVDIIDRATSGICPLGKFEAGYVQAVVQPTVSAKPFDGSHLWRELHTQQLTPSLIDNIIARTQCGTCRADAIRHVKDYPPDFSSPARSFAWGWKWHNAVNVKLGKAEMSLDEALAMYNHK